MPAPLPFTVPPVLEPVEFQNDVAVVRGSPVVLPCEAQGHPLPLVSWMKDGKPLLPQNLEQGPGLQLERAGAGDSGTYSCVAVSEAGEARRHFQLTVMGGSPAPRVRVPGPGGEGLWGRGVEKTVREAWSRLGGRSPGLWSSVESPKPGRAGTGATGVWGEAESQVSSTTFPVLLFVVH